MFIVVINKYITWSVCVCIVVINKYNSISVCVCGGLFKNTIYVKIIIERFRCVRKNYFDSDISSLFRVREVCKLFRSMIELFPPNQQYNICYVLICIQNNSRIWYNEVLFLINCLLWFTIRYKNGCVMCIQVLFYR